MIVRIVKMTFVLENVDDFIKVFNDVKGRIAGFEGCQSVKLMKDVHQDNVYFTYSIWDSDDHLQQYRYSELFEDTWKKTKILFSQRAEAWSLEDVKL